MRAIHGSALFVFLLAACSGKERPFATEVAPTTSEPGAEGMGEASAPGVAAPAPNVEGPEPVPGGGESTVPPVVSNGVDSSGAVLGASGTDSPTCGSDAGSCSAADAGPPVPPPCVPTGPRQCDSERDNDCDGLPDNVVDDVCRCVPGTTEACEAHPGFDGQGPCRAGGRTCIAGEGNATSDWGGCEGSIAPLPADSCTVAADDSDCDGIPAEGCACVDGATEFCGPATDQGICQRGTTTCVNGAFGACVGAVNPLPRDTCARGDDSNCNGIANEGCTCIDGDTRPCGTTDTGSCQLGTQTCTNGFFGGQCLGEVPPGARNCGSPADNDCDGRPDNTIDTVCQCVPGQGNAPCSGNENLARCGGSGRCEPCQVDADCALVSGGRNTCDGGQCVQDLLGAGVTCTGDDECESGRCDRWFLDRDRDGFGSDETRACAGPGGVAAPPSADHIQQGGDCCDLGGLDRAPASEVNPGQENLFVLPQTVCPDVDPFDYNCSGEIEYEYQEDTEADAGGCSFDGCEGASVWALSQMDGQVPDCGTTGLLVGCAGASPACAGRPVGQFANRCH